MRNWRHIFAAAIFLAAGFLACAAEVSVFAAASLADSLKKIAGGYEQKSGDKIIFNFAASGTLARQIEAGAPADIFFSADEIQADALDKKGLLVAGTQKSQLGNSLVAVVPVDSTNAFSSVNDFASPSVQRIAFGDFKTVPAGAYAKAYFEKLNLWPQILPKVIPFENVRAVLAAVESGNVDAGIVYKTDAAISKKARVAFAVPVADGPKISYPLALVKDSPQPAAAKKFIAYLETGAAAKVFREFGFIVLDASAGK